MNALLIGAGVDLMSLTGNETAVCSTPFGPPSAAPARRNLGSNEILVLPRHGVDHSILPHRVNYRANLWALRELGVERIFAIHSVGTLDKQVRPGALAIPMQVVDYTWGRAASFEGFDGLPRHVEVDPPFDSALQKALQAGAVRSGVEIHLGGTYGVTQGPRLETAAEIDRLERDGCSYVGMTAMPEAALARELGIPYVSCVVAVNFAAGRGPDFEGIHDQLAVYSKQGFGLLDRVLSATLA